MSNSDVQVKFSASLGAVNSAIGEVQNSLRGLGAPEALRAQAATVHAGEAGRVN